MAKIYLRHNSPNNLDVPGNNENEAFWCKGGDIMFCEICGNYVRRNRRIQDNKLTLVNNLNKSVSQHENITATTIHNNNGNIYNQHSDMERRQRVLLIKIKFDNIIDTGLYLPCRLLTNKQ